MTNCSITYDLMRSGYEAWWFPAMGLVAGAFAVIIYGAYRITPRKFVSTSAVRGVLIAIPLSIIWSMATFILTYLDYSNIRKEYENGHYQETSGMIDDYIESGPDIQPGTVRFAVGKVTFSYSRYEAGPGYRGAGSTPLRNGVSVRVKYVGKSIVGLEVCDS